MTVSRPECPLSRIAGPGAEAPCRTAEPRVSFRGPRPPAAHALPAPPPSCCGRALRSGGHQSPGERAELAGHRDDGDLRRLPAADQARVAPVEAPLSLLGVLDYASRLALEGPLESRAPVRDLASVGPCGFDEEPSNVLVPGLGDAAALLRAPARVLAWHQPDVGHELPGAGESAEVADLGEERERAQRRDSPEAQ